MHGSLQMFHTTLLCWSMGGLKQAGMEFLNPRAVLLQICSDLCMAAALLWGWKCVPMHHVSAGFGGTDLVLRAPSSWGFVSIPALPAADSGQQHHTLGWG